jgi:hypothetical protein
VLVDHRCASAGVPNPGHQLFERCAALGGPGAAGVAKVVQVEVDLRRNARGLEAGVPNPVEVAASRDAARWRTLPDDPPRTYKRGL